MQPPPVPRSLPPEDQESLRIARALLEQLGLAMRLANAVGAPLERGAAALPKNWTQHIQTVAQSALRKSLQLALKSMRKVASGSSSDLTHKFLVAASGGVGGAFGLPALAIELPLSTTLMLRSIADIARSEGHSLDDLTVRLDCLAVFGMGGSSVLDSGAESGYWAARAALAVTVTEAAAYLSGRKAIDFAAPAIVRLVGAIAARFGISVSEQVAAKAIPIVGVASGAVVNVMFLNHFQNIARGHFILRRLESRHGTDLVRDAYLKLDAKASAVQPKRPGPA